METTIWGLGYVFRQYASMLLLHGLALKVCVVELKTTVATARCVQISHSLNSSYPLCDNILL